MTCSEFDKAFDPYVDGVLDPTSAAAARMHVESCPACDRIVARWQQSRILLSTAVAEIAAAVDVSDLVAAVSSALDGDRAGEVAAPERSTSRSARRERQLHVDRAAASARVDPADRVARPAATRGRFATIRRFATVAGASAVAAAASILLLTPGAQAPLQLASDAPSASSHLASHSWVKPVAFHTDAPSSGAGWKPLLPVPALVDALEPGEGHTVSTWVQPRTQARVIWVQRRDSGPTVQTAGYEK